MPYKDKEKQKEFYRRRHAKNKQMMDTLKSAPCFDCKQCFPPYIMEFDHVPSRGKKKATIGAIKGSRSIKAPSILEELEKCDLVCANCHRTRTYMRTILTEEKTT